MGVTTSDSSEDTQEILKLLRGKWKLLIMWRLTKQKYRFNKLKKDLDNISPGILSRQLTELESSGLIKKKVYPEAPPLVEYSLTKLGMSLTPVFEALDEWANNILE